MAWRNESLRFALRLAATASSSPSASVFGADSAAPLATLAGSLGLFAGPCCVGAAQAASI